MITSRIHRGIAVPVATLWSRNWHRPDFRIPWCRDGIARAGGKMGSRRVTRHSPTPNRNTAAENRLSRLIVCIESPISLKNARTVSYEFFSACIVRFASDDARDGSTCLRCAVRYICVVRRRRWPVHVDHDSRLSRRLIGCYTSDLTARVQRQSARGHVRFLEL